MKATQHTCEICGQAGPGVRWYADPPEYGTGGYFCEDYRACRERAYQAEESGPSEAAPDLSGSRQGGPRDDLPF